MAAPVGNQNAAKKQREYHNALWRTLKQYEADGVPRGEALNIVTTKLVDLAIQGEPWAIKEIADRLDGKAPQAIHGEPGMPEPIVLKWEN